MCWFRPVRELTSRRELSSANAGKKIMAVLKGSLLLLIFCMAVYPYARDRQKRASQDGAALLQQVVLDEVSAVEVPSLPAESIGAPLLCDPAGRVILRMATPESGVEDPVSVSKDGRTVVRFGREKISDVPSPVLISIFVNGSDVYVLTGGTTPLGHQDKMVTRKGDVIVSEATRSSKYIAHFERDGTYAGAVPLDLPFKPARLGVFENGDFLIAGGEPSTDEPRLAIVGSNGQLRRFVELKGDVHGQVESGASGKGKDPTALPRFGPPGTPSLFNAVYLSQIAKEGPNLLLFRPMNGPVFSISPSGEVTAHELKVKGDYRLYTIKATGSSWIAEFLHDVPGSAAVELSTYAFDPESGTPLREYVLPKDLGTGLACTDGDEFTFVMANPKTNTLKLVTLAPAAKPN
jgi:hypothetical protein